MTTAHRPTFDPARGKEAARGEAYHQRLLPAHKTLKFRQAAQGTPDEQARRDLRAELLKAERSHYAKKDGRALPEDDEEDVEGVQAEIKAIEGGSAKRKLDDTAEGGGEAEEDYETKKRRVLEETKDIDADSDSGSSSSSESEDEDSEDETAELMRELAKIKAERAEAAAKVAAEQAKKDEEQREKDIALGNPLLNSGDYGVKRRWDDDVVFKNQARGTEERGKEKRFVNDLLRSDFHRRFMDKYVR
ncbi:complexed with cef1p [Vermiconidia calcicola]|uniref:Complexed with cef1p n=1 Tax=Vermiconidia calcicola TaxID=1690605 RepID=A0ACC3MSL4_9PEZI|nr:complexed with cef1p [Vermiconidia calcicola]